MKTDHILRHKASLNVYKKIEIIPYILSDDQGLKLDINNRNNRKLTNSWKLNSSLLTENSWSIQKLRKKIMGFLSLNREDISQNTQQRDIEPLKTISSG